jgi:hypothetical protein
MVLLPRPDHTGVSAAAEPERSRPRFLGQAPRDRLPFMERKPLAKRRGPREHRQLAVARENVQVVRHHHPRVQPDVVAPRAVRDHAGDRISCGPVCEPVPTTEAGEGDEPRGAAAPPRGCAGLFRRVHPVNLAARRRPAAFSCTFTEAVQPHCATSSFVSSPSTSRASSAIRPLPRSSRRPASLKSSGSGREPPSPASTRCIVRTED